jgi:hypothetical protein
MVFLAAMFTVNTSYSFEVQGSYRVPWQVPKNQNLRDPQPVRVPIISVEEKYETVLERMGDLKCQQEWVQNNPVDYRNFLTQWLFPSTNNYYEPQYNCYDTYGVVEKRVFSGWLVTYMLYDQYYQVLMQTRPDSFERYLTIMVR